MKGFFFFSKGGFFFWRVCFFSNGVVFFSDFPLFFSRLITPSFNVGVSYVRPSFKIQNLATWQWLPFDPNSMGHMLFELSPSCFSRSTWLWSRWFWLGTFPWPMCGLLSTCSAFCSGPPTLASASQRASRSTERFWPVCPPPSPRDLLLAKHLPSGLFLVSRAGSVLLFFWKNKEFFFSIDVSFMRFLRKKGFSVKGEVFFKNSILIQKKFSKERCSLKSVFFSNVFFSQRIFSEENRGLVFFPKRVGFVFNVKGVLFFVITSFFFHSGCFFSKGLIFFQKGFFFFKKGLIFSIEFRFFFFTGVWVFHFSTGFVFVSKVFFLGFGLILCQTCCFFFTKYA